MTKQEIAALVRRLMEKDMQALKSGVYTSNSVAQAQRQTIADLQEGKTQLTTTVNLLRGDLATMLEIVETLEERVEKIELKLKL